MAGASRGLAAAPPFNLKIRRTGATPPALYPLRHGTDSRRRRLRGGVRCCSCSDSEFRTLATGKNAAAADNAEEWRIEPKKSPRRVRTRAMQPALPFPSPRSQGLSRQKDFYPRCMPKNSAPQSRDTPPKRDTGIASEKDWGISLLDENVYESGTNEDGSTWYRESGEDLDDNGYRCRWTRMGGQSHDGSSDWKETVKLKENAAYRSKDPLWH